MSTVAALLTRDHDGKPLTAPLHNGDRFTQSEFHRRYLAYPEDVKFELICGIVYMASPLGLPHGTHHLELGTLLTLYKGATPGVEAGDNATIILGEDSEPQPDLMLRILPAFGGQSRTTDDGYIAGPPELVIEVAHSSVAIDLHAKKDDYRKAGVIEYIVVCIDDQAVRWFDLSADQSRQPDVEGILRAATFPGLWIDTGALMRKDTNKLVEVLRQGLASSEHKQFVLRLEQVGGVK